MGCSPLFFIVYKEVNFSSYADDTTPFITDMSFEQIIPELEGILSGMSQWLMLENSIFFSVQMRTKE